MDRVEATQAIAKVFAYLACGKKDQAKLWARKLYEWLGEILAN